MEGEPIDFDRGNLRAGSIIQVFNYLDNNWKAAVVQEIDTAEREILVNYDDETQEWIGVDGRKICLPPIAKTELIPSDSTVHKRASSSRTRKKSIDFKSHLAKEKSPSNSIKKTLPRSTIKSVQPSDAGRKIMSKSSSGSAFLRLKFKPNSKNVKPSVKTEATKKRKREKHFQESVDNLSPSEPDQQDIKVRKVVPKVTQSRSKEPKRDSCKLKIRIGKHEAEIVSSSNNTPPTTEKIETLAFNTTSEKKIKTLLPKRSAPETPNKVSPEVSSPMSPISTPASVPSACPTSITPILNLLPTSSGYVCPKQDCKKQFRNKNLLMMHIKHYHREYQNMLRSMPNVADLAYARTVGEDIESSQSNFLEKIVKLEEHRLNKPEESQQLNLGKNSTDDQVLTNTIPRVDENLSWNTNIESVGETAKSTPKSSHRRISSSKRSFGSESSPKLPVLMAQLQGPPLVPSSLSIESDSVDVLPLPQKKPSSVLSPQLSERSDSLIDSDERPDGGKKSPGKKRRLSQLDSTDVINCACGYGLEDGLMIQCDLCQCWQHGSCVGFENESDVPSNYTCETCQFPKRCHSSRRYSYVQNWLKEGIIPKFEFNSHNEEVQKIREKFFKLSHVSLCELTELRHAIRSLQLKIQILRQSPDHPKLYLWARSWDNHTFENEEKEKNQSSMGIGPVPEIPINMKDCRKHLSEHINKEIEKADKVLQDIEHKIEKLDELESTEGGEEEDWSNGMDKYVSIVKQTLLMMLRDLTSLQALKYCHK